MAANQSFLDNLTGLPKLWDQIKIYTKNNRFSEARFDINTSTGMETYHSSLMPMGI